MLRLIALIRPRSGIHAGAPAGSGLQSSTVSENSSVGPHAFPPLAGAVRTTRVLRDLRFRFPFTQSEAEMVSYSLQGDMTQSTDSGLGSSPASFRGIS